MKFSLKNQETQVLLKQRVVLVGVSLCLLVANVLLVILLVTRQERWILIPQFDTDRRMSLTESTFSDSYLTEWAVSICEDLLTANPHTVTLKKERFLQVAARPQGKIQENLSKMVDAIQRDGAHTAFYPKTTRLNRSENSISVSGTFFLYLGRDHRPVVSHRTFTLRWRRGPHGVLLIEDMMEEKESS